MYATIEPLLVAMLVAGSAACIVRAAWHGIRGSGRSDAAGCGGCGGCGSDSRGCPR